jgi:hypothetical protein
LANQSARFAAEVRCRSVVVPLSEHGENAGAILVMSFDLGLSILVYATGRIVLWKHVTSASGHYQSDALDTSERCSNQCITFLKRPKASRYSGAASAHGLRVFVRKA